LRVGKACSSRRRAGLSWRSRGSRYRRDRWDRRDSSGSTGWTNNLRTRWKCCHCSKLGCRYTASAKGTTLPLLATREAYKAATFATTKATALARRRCMLKKSGRDVAVVLARSHGLTGQAANLCSCKHTGHTGGFRWSDGPRRDDLQAWPGRLPHKTYRPRSDDLLRRCLPAWTSLRSDRRQWALVGL